MRDSPAVQCPMCWELVSWGNVPEHLENHNGDTVIRAVVVEGEKPDIVTTGESDPDAPQILWTD